MKTITKRWALWVASRLQLKITTKHDADSGMTNTVVRIDPRPAGDTASVDGEPVVSVGVEVKSPDGNRQPLYVGGEELK